MLLHINGKFQIGKLQLTQNILNDTDGWEHHNTNNETLCFELPRSLSFGRYHISIRVVKRLRYFLIILVQIGIIAKIYIVFTRAL